MPTKVKEVISFDNKGLNYDLKFINEDGYFGIHICPENRHKWKGVTIDLNYMIEKAEAANYPWEEKEDASSNI